ncbi:hypothetical protein [Cypionkella sp.]|uniref:hypothetical protein n=1 Tax=Cypionkella sp. TaxID=2811411 RepID=UPI00351D908A
MIAKKTGQSARTIHSLIYNYSDMAEQTEDEDDGSPISTTRRSPMRSTSGARSAVSTLWKTSACRAIRPGRVSGVFAGADRICAEPMSGSGSSPSHP